LKAVDTNIFIHYLLEGNLAGEAERLLALYSDLAVTHRIIDKVIFTLIRLDTLFPG
jgi:predicted nucleic acid-binding protein